MHVPFVITTFVGVGLPLFVPGRADRTRRRLFLTGLAIATVSAFFITYPPDWQTGVGLSFFVGALMVLNALRFDSYLVFGGKTVELPGVFSSSQRLWWAMVPATALCVFVVGRYVFARENPMAAVVMAAVLVLIASAFGYANGRAGDSVAERQTLQFVLVSIVTVGVFALLYLVAYGIGRRVRAGSDRPRHSR